MAEVKLGGVWLHSLGHVSDVKWSTQWGTGPCGPSQASCTIAVDPSNDSTLLQLGRPFEVWDAGKLRFGGVLAEMGRDFPRSLSARSWASRGGDFDAVDVTNKPTTRPYSAVQQAILNGLPWHGPDVFSDTSLGTDGTATSARINDLLNSWAVAVGKRWGVGADQLCFVATDPTTPSWYLNASDLDIGVADDGLYTRVRAWFVSSLNPTTGDPNGWSTVVVNDAVGQALYGVIEYSMDLTPLGILASGTATSYAQAQLNLLTVPQWLSRVTTNSQRLLAPGGLPASLSSVQAGQMVRLFNVPNNLGGLRGELGLDVVLGEVEYDTESPAEVTIAPVGIAVRNLVDALTQAAQTAQSVAAGDSPIFRVVGKGGNPQ